MGVGLCVPSTLFGLRSAWHLFAHSETLAAKLGKLRYPKKQKKKRKKWEKMKEKLASTYIWGIARGEFVKRTLLGDNSIELGTSVVPCTPSLPHFGPFFLHVSRVGSSKLKSGNGSDKITHTHACI